MLRLKERSIHAGAKGTAASEWTS